MAFKVQESYTFQRADGKKFSLLLYVALLAIKGITKFIVRI
jgi:hypothetical protein